MSSYYNYQIGIFFAILIGGLLLLFLFVAAVYFGCVLTLRSNKKKQYSAPNSIRAAPPRQWQPTEQMHTPYTNLYATRGTPTEQVLPQSPLVQSPMVNQSQAPFNMPREIGVDQPYRPQQQYYQEKIVTEPVHSNQTTWQTVPTPVPVTTVVGYMPTPVQSSPPAPAFHTSSV